MTATLFTFSLNSFVPWVCPYIVWIDRKMCSHSGCDGKALQRSSQHVGAIINRWFVPPSCDERKPV